MSPSTFPFPSTASTRHPSPKLHISTASLPPYISPAHPPSKTPPFRQIDSVPFVRTATLILPEELYHTIISHFNATSDSSDHSLLQPTYAKFIAPLGSLLSGAFFTGLIKRPASNILGLSEGTPGVHDTFSLNQGHLRLELCRESYEKLGLQGVVVKKTGAREHVKTRWRVDVDLRAPSSVAGKKMFEKLKKAGEGDGVLAGGRAWIVVDDEGLGRRDVWEEEGVRRVLHPVVCEGLIDDGTGTGMDGGGVELATEVDVPDVLRTGDEVAGLDEEEWWEMLEWIDLVSLGSPRVRAGDLVDEYISRYRVPQPSTSQNVRLVKWEGLMSSEWVTNLMIKIIKVSRKSKGHDWAALSVTAHQVDAVGGVDGYTVVLQPGGSGGKNEYGEDVDKDDAMDVDDDEKEKDGESQDGTGLQRSMCFQLIDSQVS